MTVAMVLLVLSFLVASQLFYSTALPRYFPDSIKGETLGSVVAVASYLSQYGCPVIFLVNNAKQVTPRLVKEIERIQEPRGVAVLEVAADRLNSNATQTHLRTTIDQIRQMGQLWHCLALVLVSDDPNFLASFAYMSRRRHALMWSMRILIFTRLPLRELDGLHDFLSNRNSVLLAQDKGTNSSVGVYVAWPYSAATIKPRRVLTWTPNTNWSLALQKQLFPEKFFVFTSAPTLTVAIELLPHHTISEVQDPYAPEKHSLAFTGFMDKTIRYFAKAMNFTYKYVVSPERTFGTKLPDGSWNGMMGMVVREEVDIGTGPFLLSPVRAEAGDYTMTIWTGSVKMVSGLTGLKVDPWGFLLPLTPVVWAATLTALLGVFAVLQLLPSCLPRKTMDSRGWQHNNAFSCVRVILQQDTGLPGDLWWWERMVMGVWMLTTLVMTKSFAGNLMSLLAVRYIPQPFQTPRDVLNDPHVTMIWQKYSRNEQFLREVESGEFREAADLEKKGRLLFHTQAQFPESLDTLVRAGDHVLVDVEMSIRNLLALDVSQKGRCDFYLSRDGFLPYSSAIMSHKTSPIIHGLNPRVMSLWESGLFKYWMENVPNFTRCNNVPKRLLFTTFLSITNLWGVFVVLAAGLAAGLVFWCAELLVSLDKQHSLPSTPLSASSY